MGSRNGSKMTKHLKGCCKCLNERLRADCGCSNGDGGQWSYLAVLQAKTSGLANGLDVETEGNKRFNG